MAAARRDSWGDDYAGFAGPARHVVAGRRAAAGNSGEDGEESAVHRVPLARDDHPHEPAVMWLSQCGVLPQRIWQAESV